MPITSTAAQEQAWNRQQLEQPVVAPLWRVWTYEQPALVLGCSQRALYERAASGARSVEVLLRESGGGAVLTGPWLVSVSLVLPPGHAWLGQGLLESYRRLGQLHADALAELGVAASALPPAQIPDLQDALAKQGPPAPDWACFGSLSPWEVVDAGGRKLVGLAQRRRRQGVLLVAGTLLAPPDWGLLCETMGQPHAATLLRQRTVACEQLLGRVLAPATWRETLAGRLAQALG
ncbi:ligase [Rhodoferax sp. BAB1]|uniref:lipoate--protein ligase family protein n=1 Tax=Rhodoferax sp. BAB1 TaxID=2741720 RepID=UPI0015776A95|nr:ligase [Rhodoferax sp. BAB1]QKO21647.1 ligase [Rhodoferax sp. BAB1]